MSALSPPGKRGESALSDDAISVASYHSSVFSIRATQLLPPPKEQVYRDFSSITNEEDLIIEVEGREAFAHRTMIEMVSPVLKSLMNEASQNACGMQRIILHDFRYEDVLEFLQVIYPPWRDITASNVRKMIRLAAEFEVEGILHKCEELLLRLRISNCNISKCLMAYCASEEFGKVTDLLCLASQFKLVRLKAHLVALLAKKPILWANDGEFFEHSGTEIENAVLREALKEVLHLVDKNTYCSSVKSQLS